MIIPPIDSVEYKRWQKEVMAYHDVALLCWGKPKYIWYPDKVIIEREFIPAIMAQETGQEGAAF